MLEMAKICLEGGCMDLAKECVSYLTAEERKELAIWWLNAA